MSTLRECVEGGRLAALLSARGGGLWALVLGVPHIPPATTAEGSQDWESGHSSYQISDPAASSSLSFPFCSARGRLIPMTWKWGNRRWRKPSPWRAEWPPGHSWCRRRWAAEELQPGLRACKPVWVFCIITEPVHLCDSGFLGRNLRRDF